MHRMDSDWYRKTWTLDIQDQAWTEDTTREVDFIISKLSLQRNERILDLACGFGAIHWSLHGVVLMLRASISPLSM